MRRYPLNASGKRNETENGNKTEWNANGHTVLRMCSGNKTGTIFLNVHIYIHTQIHMYTRTHVHIHTYTHTHVHTYTYTHIHIYTYTCTHIHIHTYTNTHVHMYTYTHTHIHTYTCTHVHIHTYTHTVWVTKKFPFSLKQQPCNGNFAFRFRACSILHNYSCVYFCCVGKIILRTWNGEQTVKKTVKRTLYVLKAGARKLLISKELPISKNGDCLATTPSAIF